MDCDDDDDGDVHFEDLPEESDFVEELFLNFGDGINSMTFDGLIPAAKLISPINPSSLYLPTFLMFFVQDSKIFFQA